MAKWRSTDTKIKDVRDFTLSEVRNDVILEVGDMIEVISGEFPYRDITNQMNWVVYGGDRNRFSVVHSEYVKRESDYVNKCLLMPLEGSIADVGLVQMNYDPYMRGMIQIFPVDTVDSWVV